MNRKESYWVISSYTGSLDSLVIFLKL